MNATIEKFHTFDALRFFSFLLVFIAHFVFSFSHFELRGDIGVYFFFSLSGFLITYIILFEKKKNSIFNFKTYLIRRFLKIWPLYYLMIFFAFLTPFLLSIIGLKANSIGYEPNFFISCLFLENYMIIYHHIMANVAPLPVMWSLCVEEHFYIIWGIILLLNKQINIPYWIVGIIIVSNISRFFFLQNDIPFYDILTNFDYFMYGAIPAYLYLNYKEASILKINRIPNIYKFLLILISIFYIFITNFLAFGFKKLIEPTFFGILFSCILFITLPKKNIFKINDSNLFSRLGVYTYGLYMIHTIVIVVFLRISEKMKFNIPEYANYLIFSVCSLTTSIILSKVCYKFIERPFLKLKPKY